MHVIVKFCTDIHIVPEHGESFPISEHLTFGDLKKYVRSIYGLTAPRDEPLLLNSLDHVSEYFGDRKFVRSDDGQILYLIPVITEKI